MSKENEKDNISFLTVQDVSKRLSKSASIVYTLLNYEKLPSIKIGGRIVVKEEALNEWIKKNVNPNEENKQEGGKK